jgi:anti-sigma regulatory factor (Ser/Thr protein kinase)/CheY-like chemotaxis protein
VERIREVNPDIPVVLFSSSEDLQAMKSALHLQVNAFLAKPFDSEALIACVEGLLSGVNVRHRSAETAQAVRMAQRALVAVPEKDLPLYSVHQSLTDAGGDVFRCFKQPDGSILFILADVAGHAVISSYAVAAFLGLLSSLVSQYTDLSTLTLRLNRGIQDGPFSEVPVCALLGHWTPRTGRLHVLNAGLPHGLCGGLLRRLRIALNGTPLGVFDEPMVEEKVLMLEAGERVLFASDGFFDIRGPEGELMEEMALNLWSEMGDVPIQQAVSILAGIAQKLAEEGLEDDLLAVGFEQPTPDTGALRLNIPSEATAIDEVILRMAEYLGEVPRSIPLTHSRRFEILTAAREALTNAMIHGNQGRADSRISLHARWEAYPPAFILKVVDEGLGFDLKNLAPPTDPLSERGRGIPYLRHSASKVDMVGGELSITFSWEA